MSTKKKPVGRPRKKVDTVNFNMRLPERMREHWKRHVAENAKYNSVSEMIQDLMNVATVYEAPAAVKESDLDSL